MNMSYCRFENTLKDLRDCFDNMDSNDLSESEFNARKQMIELCWDIYTDYCNIIDDEFEEEPEYDSAGFTEDDRIVDGQYRVIDNDK